MNAFKIQQQQQKTQNLHDRCRALLKSGDRVGAVRLYRRESGSTLKASIDAVHKLGRYSD